MRELMQAWHDLHEGGTKWKEKVRQISFFEEVGKKRCSSACPSIKWLSSYKFIYNILEHKICIKSLWLSWMLNMWNFLPFNEVLTNRQTDKPSNRRTDRQVHTIKLKRTNLWTETTKSCLTSVPLLSHNNLND